MKRARKKQKKYRRVGLERRQINRMYDLKKFSPPQGRRMVDRSGGGEGVGSGFGMKNGER